MKPNHEETEAVPPLLVVGLLIVGAIAVGAAIGALAAVAIFTK